MAMSVLPRGPVLCPPHIALPSTSAAVLLSRKRLGELPPKVPWQPSQGLEQGCREKAGRLHQLGMEGRLQPGLVMTCVSPEAPRPSPGRAQGVHGEERARE